MDHSEHLLAVDDARRALDAAFASGPLSAPVPSCEGWTLVELAVHLGGFYGFWSHVLCEGTGRPRTPNPEPPGGDALAGWLAGLGEHLLRELEATPPETPVWTWHEPDRSAGFVARRCAHELTIHRFDAQAARGTEAPIAPATAIDGIDEMVRVLVLARERSGRAHGQRLLLEVTDPGLATVRLVTLLPDRVDVHDDTGAADLVLRGSASDLELLLYGRTPLGPLDRTGDPTVLDAWYREFVF